MPPTASRCLHAVGLALATLTVLALAEPTVATGTNLAHHAGAHPLAVTGEASTGEPDDPPGSVTTTSVRAGPATTPTTRRAGPGRRRVPPGGVVLVDQTDWVDEGEPFDLWVRIGEDAGPDDALVLDLHAPVTSRSQFAATLEGRLLRSRRAEFVVPLGELATGPGGSRRLRLTPERTEAPAERHVGPLPRAGVYPLVVSIRPADVEAEPSPPVTTYLVRTPAPGTTPLQVALVQPVASDLALQPDGSIALGTTELARLADIVDVLAASAGTPLTLTPRPETLEALRLLAGMDADARSDEARAILEALSDAAPGRQIVSGPFVDVTLDALEGAELGDEVAAQRTRGDLAVEKAIDADTDVRTWVEDDGASPRALRRLASLGVHHIVVPDESLSPVDLRLSLSRPFSISSEEGDFALEAASPEPALSAHYAATDPVLGAQHLLADLAVLHGDEPGPLRPRGVVVAPPAGGRTDPVLLAAVLDGLAGSPVLEPVTLGTYFDEVGPEGGVEDPLMRDLSPAPARLGITADDVRAVRDRLESLSSVIEEELAPEQPLSDLILLAQADGLGPAERRAYLAEVAERIDRRLGPVSIIDRASFRLPDSEGTVPLTIVRSGGEPLSVRVVLQSDKLAFHDATTPASGRVSYDVELTSENTPLVVPVRVRSPGTFPLLVTITSPDGRLELARSQVTIHSTAFSGVGVALSAGAGLFLLLWWARHWRTVRRAKRLVPVG